MVQTNGTLVDDAFIAALHPPTGCGQSARPEAASHER
jgi:hypothetical protein